MRRILTGLVALTLALAAGPAVLPASPAGASLGSAYRGAHAGLQAGAVVIMASGDVSPPTNETKGDDYATSEVVLKAGPDLVLTLGDNQYEAGSGAMFASAVGYDGSWGRFKGITRPSEGNHDAAAVGAGSPGFQTYFADRLTGFECERLSPPCRPDQGYYDFDLPNGWYVLVVNSNCGRAPDPATPNCAQGSPQHTWLNYAQARRHGGASSGQKCSLAVWHHERWGTSFFADDPALHYLWGNLNYYHADLVLSGHSHSTGRTGAMTPSGTLSPTGAGIRQLTAGAGGRSLTPHRVNPPRVGTRYRDNTRYGVLRLVLTGSTSPAGWQGGTWTSEFDYVNGTVADPASAGCWP